MNALCGLILLCLFAGILAASANEEKPLRFFRPDPPGMPAYTLPDPLRMLDGQPVESAEAWFERRRPELLELFRVHVFGRVPAPACRRLEARRLNRELLPHLCAVGERWALEVRQGSRTLTFHFSLFIPNRSETSPLVLLISNRANIVSDTLRPPSGAFWPVAEILRRGFATAAFYASEVDPDHPNGFSEGVRGLFADGSAPAPDAWGTLGAWAWAASRIADVLAEHPSIDSRRMAVVGHSRGGKTALWAAAQDERFVLACVNESGCGGANILRRRFAGRESVELINRMFPHWFNANFKAYAGREDELPVDHHQLIALVAPRWVHVGSAENDIWADPRGEFLGTWHATPVYRLLGRGGLPDDQMPPIGRVVRGDGLAYHIRRGRHDLMLEDWRAYLDTAAVVFGSAIGATSL